MIGLAAGPLIPSVFQRGPRFSRLRQPVAHCFDTRAINVFGRGNPMKCRQGQARLYRFALDELNSVRPVRFGREIALEQIESFSVGAQFAPKFAYALPASFGRSRRIRALPIARYIR